MQSILNNDILVLYWQIGDSLASAISATLRRMGYRVDMSLNGLPLPEGPKILIAHGPLGKLEGLRLSLNKIPEDRRPSLVFWQTEQFPDPRIPNWLGKWIGDRLLDFPGWLSQRGNRFRYLAELRQLERDKILTTLGVTSAWTANYLKSFGLDAITAYLGYCLEWGDDLGLERDIPVLWLGQSGSTRRARLIHKVREELKQRGVDLLVVDGLEHPRVLGEERTKLLNRTRIVLNLMRQPWDDNSMRLYLAAANQAMVISEPMLPHTPFLSGKHLVEANPSDIAEVVCYYLENEDQRRQIVDNAWQLVREELTMENSLQMLLQATMSRIEVTLCRS